VTAPLRRCLCLVTGSGEGSTVERYEVDEAARRTALALEEPSGVIEIVEHP